MPVWVQLEAPVPEPPYIRTSPSRESYAAYDTWCGSPGALVTFAVMFVQTPPW
ncbi:MAG: hypothetical protein ACHQ16_00255 [Candidatus Lutacidiplasmatales archaeon]